MKRGCRSIAAVFLNLHCINPCSVSFADEGNARERLGVAQLPFLHLVLKVELVSVDVDVLKNVEALMFAMR